MKIDSGRQQYPTAVKGRFVAAGIAALSAGCAKIHRRIRGAHLETHLQQTALLGAGQNAAYKNLRGYAAAPHHH